MAVACVSVDLDSIKHYCAIHNLPEKLLSDKALGAVYTEALPRFLELFEEAGIKATFFVVGSDLSAQAAVDGIKDAASEGHEIANHSFSHDYSLTRFSPADIEADVERAAVAIADTIGKRPVGFRAPGYTLTAPLLRAAVATGCTYDSSVFPSLPYWAAKAAIVGAMELVRRPSRSIIDRARVLVAPTLPYVPDQAEPYRALASNGDGIAAADCSNEKRFVEMPISVAPITRIPLIGTTAIVLPQEAFGLIVRSFRKMPFLNFELHGIDLLDQADVCCPRLAWAQPDLGITRAAKKRRILNALKRIREYFDLTKLEDASKSDSILNAAK